MSARDELAALSVPVVPEPQAPDVAAEQLDFLHRVTLPDLRREVQRHQDGKARWRKRAETAEARVAELEAERHSTNEALSEAAEQLRVDRDRIAELEAQRERRRVRLVALQNDALSMRGSLSPMGKDRKVPFPLGETLTPAVDWLIGRVAELEARPSPADVLRQAADDLTAACPEHSDADEAWMDCPCEFADELRRKAVLVGSGADVPLPGERPVNELTDTFVPVASLREDEPDTLSFAERAGRETNPGRRAAWRMLAEPEPEFHAYLHHDNRVSHDRPETGGAGRG